MPVRITPALIGALFPIFGEKGPIAYWKLNDTSGTTAVESIAGSNGTYVGSPTLSQASMVQGDNEYSVSFDGTDDVVTTSFLGPTGTSGRSISFWIKKTVSTSDHIPIIGWGGEDDNTWYGVIIRSSSSTNLSIYFGNNNYITYDNMLSATHWNHIVVTFDGTNHRLYRNGVLQTATGSNGSMGSTGSDNNLKMADLARASDTYSFVKFQGFLDKVIIWDRDIRQSEVSALYEQTLTLLHFDGTNGETSHTDVVNNTITTYGSAALTTSYFESGTASLDITARTQSAAFNVIEIGLADFTIEGWFKTSKTSTDITNDPKIAWSTAPLNQPTTISAGVAANLVMFRGDGTTDIGAAVSIDDGEFHHIAWVRRNGTVTIYVDGTSIASGDYSSAAIAAAEFHVGPGNQAFDPYWFEGQIDDFRAIFGKAIYTSNFTPPTSALTEHSPRYNWE